MSIQKVSYEDKVDLQIWASIPNTNKIKAEDMNGIKKAINGNADELSKSQKDITSQNKQLQILTNALASETQEGESINIKGTVPVKFKEFKVSGNSKQETRSGKNMLNITNISTTSGGVTITSNEDGSITLNGTATQNNWIELITNLKVSKGDNVLSLRDKIGGLGLYLGSEANTDYAVTQTTTTEEKTFNLQEDTIFDVVRLRIIEGTAFNNLTVYPMLEKGTVATDYEPYGAMPSPEYPSEIHNVEGDVNVTVANKEKTEQQTVTFPLSEGQKLMLGDYLADDGIHHKRKQRELDGTENILILNWTTPHTKTTIFNVLNVIDKKVDIVKFCNYFKVVKNTSENINKDEEYCFNDITGGVYFSISNDIASTIEKFKAWLATKKQEGNPLVVEYELAEEEIETYTEEQQETYNKLKELMAYEEEINVYSTNEVGPVFTVTAVQNTNAVLTQLKQLILEGGN